MRKIKKPNALRRGYLNVSRSRIVTDPILRRRSIVFATVFFVLILSVIRLVTGPSYVLAESASLLPNVPDELSKKLTYDQKKQAYTFSYGSASKEASQTTSPPISVTAPRNAKKGVSVHDGVNELDMTITPKFSLASGKSMNGHVVYPLQSQPGWLVYSMQSTGVKEDILLKKKGADSAKYTYELKFGNGLEARLEVDGSVGIYGNTLLSGNVTTGNSKDAELLKKARENAKKDTLLFRIPRPIVHETGVYSSKIAARYSLKGKELTLNVSNLQSGHYPISIDPSVYVTTAEQFMSGNNETNIDFDVTNKLIKKGATTGARFDAWNATQSLNSSYWKQGVAVAGGYIYTAGGEHPLGGIKTSTAAGTDSFTIPSGVTSVTIKAWGGGGGGGGGGRQGAGRAGGAGAYATTTASVSAGQTLDIVVGSGGGLGTGNGTNSGGGGGGGGYSRVMLGGTTLVLASGGGGGGGGGRTGAGSTGGIGGAGGDTSTGQTGGTSGAGSNGGGGPGTNSAGGAGGTGGSNSGSAGGSLQGGAGADGRSAQGNDGGGANGGASGGGGAGGARDVTTQYAGGGGGAGGYYGGGGGSGSDAANSAGGGGGGSSYTTGGSATAGSGTTPGNSGDSDRAGAGAAGSGGGTGANGTAGSAGIVVITYTGDGTSKTVSWAKFNTSDGTIQSANPGNGACSGWCTSSDYDLPVGLKNFSLVAYNGFLFAIGGEDSSCTTGNGTGDNGVCKSVYIAKLGANGEPQLWHPTNGSKSSWVYWYRDTDLSSPRSNIKAVAYNNRMYLMGGITSSGGVKSVVNTTQIADITALGMLGSWSASSTLPYNAYGYTAQVYNDRLYILGGASSVGGSPLSTVYYAKISSTGTLGAWTQTTSMPSGRMTSGGDIGSVWGAYIYVSGGCGATNGSGYCTSISNSTIVASINADGTIDSWNTVGSVSDTRTSQSFVAWRGYLYEIGGCSAQNTTTGDCTTALSDIKIGKINQDGDASTVDQSVPAGTSPCSGGTPTGCDLPGTTYVGNILNASVVANGYLYVIGGCLSNTCGSTSANVAYTAISSTGKMTAPTCNSPNNLRGNTWCVDTTHTISGGIAAASPVIFNGRLYLVGGLDGTGNTDSVSRTILNSDGSINAWKTQTMSGLGMNSVSYLYSFARANPTATSTVPGNLYVLGGCSATSAMGCTAYSQNVYKCDIQVSGVIAGCSTSGQLQIGIIPGDSATGLGIMSGTVYANYVYLIGGVSPNQQDLTTVRYAKIDDNNNIVTTGSGWVESGKTMEVGRRRAAAFGYNGYIYVVGGYDAGTGVLADIEFVKVNVSDGSLGSATDGFHVSAVNINRRWGLSLPISNSFAYAIGGCTSGNSPTCNSGGPTDNIQTFQVYNNDSGAPAGYSTAANTYTTDANRVGASAAVYNGKLYVAGGCTSATDCTTASNNVSYATIDSYGNLGSWSSTSGNLPAGRTWGKLVAAGSSLYYIGGQSSTASDERSEVYWGSPAGGGDVTSWSSATNGLPANRTKLAAAVWNDRIYVVGGLDSSAVPTKTVYVSPQLSSGGNITSAWSTTSPDINVSRSGATAVAYANNVYVMGGYDGTNYLSDVQFSKIDTSTGGAGSWSYSTSLPMPLAFSNGFAANGYIYLLGGKTSDGACSPRTLVAPISANTTISSGNNPTGIGSWFETNQRFTSDRYGAAAAYYDGKAFVTGGMNCVSSPVTFAVDGDATFTVPSGVTSITVKMWGAGGGGGGGGNGAAGAAGGGAGYTTATLSVTAGENLVINVGGGGNGGVYSSAGSGAGGGGGGGGYSSIYRDSTALLIAAGGGGGGGGRQTTAGGQGGPGGGTGSAAGTFSGTAGTTVGNGGGGGAGTTSGGAGGSGGNNGGTAGSSLTGGPGADGRSAAGTDGSGATGGVFTAGNGGLADVNVTRSGGGGGGAGVFGGGGGGSTTSATGNAGGGGGGGSNYVVTGATSVTSSGGTTSSPGNSGDASRNGAGSGGGGGASTGAGSAGTDGRVIITYTASPSYASPATQQTTLLSQPQVAKYSIMMDVDSDVFPNYWLLNGVDNSIGARWQLRYRSMTNYPTTSCTSPAMTTWGQEVVFGNVTLGTPGVYTPLNGSGTNTSCARFYYFNVSVDSSQAYGYPDDVTRGPTIDDLTLQFTADPSKRLMHGRTFAGGLQQPNDTPYYAH